MTSPPNFEQQAADGIRTLLTWCGILSAGLLLTIGIAVIGFTNSSSAAHTAALVAQHQATLAKKNATVANHVAVLATQQAALAAEQAAAANSTSAAALTRLQADAAGECYRVNYLRWQVDHADYASWRRDVITARFLARIPDRPLRAVARAFHLAAQAWHFLPLTDCAAATSSPATYRAPTAIPFNQVSPAQLHQALLSPPQPPGAP